MISAIINLIAVGIKPLAEMRRAKKSNKHGESGELRSSDVALAVVKTIAFWGVVAMLIFAMSKGIISMDDFDHIIKTVKE